VNTQKNSALSGLHLQSFTFIRFQSTAKTTTCPAFLRRLYD
jgi:hypothetical protein